MKKILALFFVLVIIGAISGCGEMAKTKPRERSDDSAVANPPASDGRSIRDAVRDADGRFLSMLDHTYTDKKYGFNFKYSGDWQAKEIDNGVKILLPDDSGKKVGGVMILNFAKYNPGLMKSTQKDAEKEFKKIGADYKIQDYEKIKFSGEDCVYYKTIERTDQGSQIANKHYVIDCKGRCIATITISTVPGYEDKLAPYFDAMLKTFQM